MIESWIIASAALAYLSALFLIAWAGDRYMRTRVTVGRGTSRPTKGGRPAIYALSLAVYCTSWTFFGSVGLATTTGLGFIPVYLGPILMFTIGWPLVIRIVRLAKSQNTTSIADFLAARYGKSQRLAALVAVIALLGVLPYLALQLKAVSLSLETMIGRTAFTTGAGATFLPTDMAFSVALLMAVFAILFGTRHIDATEHQEGLMVAVAAESVVKITTFLFVGAFVTWGMFSGLGDIYAQARATPHIVQIFEAPLPWANWLATTILSFSCILLLPRQFHVAVVENTSELEVRRAAWMLPLYLVLINLFVVPIAVAGMLLIPGKGISADTFVLGLPLSHGANGIAMVAFIGGLSAATAMVIVESIALAIMVCNGLVLPVILHRRSADSDRLGPSASADDQDMGPLLIRIRRIVIFMILALAYLFYRTLGQSAALASIGLLSFAAIAQLAPAFFGGLFWRRATARGALSGLLAGFVIWAYTLLMPWTIKAGWGASSILTDGPFGWSWLRPEALFGVHGDTLASGVMWSLLVNTLAYIGGSLSRAPEPIERVQANIFILDDQPRRKVPAFRLWRTSVTVGDLMQTTRRYLGTERADRSFQEYAAANAIDLHAHAEADSEVLRFTELLLARAIGAPSARLVVSLLLRRHSVSDHSNLRLLDDASDALQYNRDLLQSALDHVRHGLAVFDKDMRLICWNHQFRQLLELPDEFVRVGAPVDQIVRFFAERGDLGPGKVDDLIKRRIGNLSLTQETLEERRIGSMSRIIAVRTDPMPQGGFVTTYSDITERAEAAEALKRANESLERRVRERTAELTKVNEALGEAKSKADQANLDKTRFLAAASHDILQPLNAARLYVSALVEKTANQSWSPLQTAPLARNIDASLEAVEEILNALMEISRLDSGHLQPDLAAVDLNTLFEQMRLEFDPAARDKGLELRIVNTTAHVRSDRRLLRRILQNLVSNAIKYTVTGCVLIGCRRRGSSIIIQVADTGLGIPADQQSQVFKEFERLAQTASSVRGLGLGLSIVDRIGRVLDHPVTLASVPGRGSSFYVALPALDVALQATPSRPALPSSTHRLEGVTVLCIDNEPAILDGMRALIEGWGAHVLTAADKQSAVAQLSGNVTPDIILADYHLDVGNGLDVVAAVRDAVGARIPAIIITADVAPELQRRVREDGLLMLRKPVKAAPLRAILTQVTQHRLAAE